MKQFNDVVTYVRNGQEIPALVAASREVNEEERLQLAYLDPDNGEVQLAVHGTVSRAYSVEPWKEGAVNGWKDYNDPAVAIVLHGLNDRCNTLRQENEKLREQITGEQLEEADAVHDEIMSREEPQTTAEAPTAEVTTQP